MPASVLAAQLDAVKAAMPFGVSGRVDAMNGLTIEAVDLALPIGSMCRIRSFGGREALAEVIGIRQERTMLMPLSPATGVARGDVVENVASSPRIWCSEELLGRVVDGYGRPTDGKRGLKLCQSRPIDAPPPPAMDRRTINQPIATGTRAIDGLLTCGLGQRMGIFSGPGVGKSTLISSIARNTSADVSVVALIGERGKEVQDFLTQTLGSKGLEKCVMVVSTGDEPPLMRVRAAKVATTIAEYFRDQGKNVLLLLDSLTRLCQAQRQIGLAAMEPPATKGYPPSVFAMLPPLLERAGKTEKGSITGFYTVLVEGDDFNEPIPDAVKGITDGHLWLNRTLASKGHYPAIDVLESISRVRSDVVPAEQLKAARRVLALLGTYREIEDMVSVGAYVPGVNAEFDVAVQARPKVLQYLQQESSLSSSMEQTKKQLMDLVNWIEQLDKALRAQAAKPAVRK